MSMIGKKLAHYEITSQFGKGGMGKVYQAKGRKLGRDVAIKVLPEELARDADRVARFQMKSRFLSRGNRPCDKEENALWIQIRPILNLE
jgi:serine/threonine protein kinase